jgi:hypothetical protein
VYRQISDSVRITGKPEVANALTEFKVHGGRMNEEQMKVVEQQG